MRRLKHPPPVDSTPVPELVTVTPLWQCCRCQKQALGEECPTGCDCGAPWLWLVNREQLRRVELVAELPVS